MAAYRGKSLLVREARACAKGRRRGLGNIGITMTYVVQAVPLLVVAVFVALILRSSLRGRVSWRLPARPPRPKKSRLRDVSRDQMDDDLRDLLRKP